MGEGEGGVAEGDSLWTNFRDANTLSQRLWRRPECTAVTMALTAGTGALAGKGGLSRQPQHLHSTIISPFADGKARPREVHVSWSQEL